MESKKLDTTIEYDTSKEYANEFPPMIVPSQKKGFIQDRKLSPFSPKDSASYNHELGKQRQVQRGDMNGEKCITSSGTGENTLPVPYIDIAGEEPEGKLEQEIPIGKTAKRRVARKKKSAKKEKLASPGPGVNGKDQVFRSFCSQHIGYILARLSMQLLLTLLYLLYCFYRQKLQRDAIQHVQGLYQRPRYREVTFRNEQAKRGL